MTAYLCMMGIRLTELHRVLKPTGSLFLHCDPTASHYLKILLDAVFGARMYRNEIVWKRTSAHNDARNGFSDLTDIILFFQNPNVSRSIANTKHTRRDMRIETSGMLSRMVAGIPARTCALQIHDQTSPTSGSVAQIR